MAHTSAESLAKQAGAIRSRHLTSISQEGVCIWNSTKISASLKIEKGSIENHNQWNWQSLLLNCKANFLLGLISIKWDENSETTKANYFAYDMCDK